MCAVEVLSLFLKPSPWGCERQEGGEGPSEAWQAVKYVSKENLEVNLGFSSGSKLHGSSRPIYLTEVKFLYLYDECNYLIVLEYLHNIKVFIVLNISEA